MTVVSTVKARWLVLCFCVSGVFPALPSPPVFSSSSLFAGTAWSSPRCSSQRQPRLSDWPVSRMGRSRGCCFSRCGSEADVSFGKSLVRSAEPRAVWRRAKQPFTATYEAFYHTYTHGAHPATRGTVLICPPTRKNGESADLFPSSVLPVQPFVFHR